MKYASKLIKFSVLSSMVGRHPGCIKKTHFVNRHKIKMKELDQYLEKWLSCLKEDVNLKTKNYNQEN